MYHLFINIFKLQMSTRKYPFGYEKLKLKKKNKKDKDKEKY